MDNTNVIPILGFIRRHRRPEADLQQALNDLRVELELLRDIALEAEGKGTALANEARIDASLDAMGVWLTGEVSKLRGANKDPT